MPKDEVHNFGYCIRKFHDLYGILRLAKYKNILHLNLYFCFKKVDVHLLFSLCPFVSPMIREPELPDWLPLIPIQLTCIKIR
jgi:hypothetical protein